MRNHAGHEGGKEGKSRPGSFFFGLLVSFVALFSGLSAQTASAPGAPGEASLPVNAPREAFATSATFDSKVWFALRGGVMAEASWPRVALTQIRSLVFAVTDGRTFAVAEDDPGIVHQLLITNPRALSFRQINFHPIRRFSISKSYAIDHDSSTVLVNVEFIGQTDQQLYVVCDPALAGTDLKDTASAYGGQGAFVMYEGDAAAALVANVGFDEMSVGFQGTSDGWTELRKSFRLTKRYDKAVNGNVVCVARIKRPVESVGKPLRFTLALSFSDEPETALTEAEHALEADFASVQKEYEKGWGEWLAALPRPASKDEAQLNMAAMMLKAQEDKIGRSQVRHGKGR
ncbi:MAG TPA: hypothetical protein VFD58_28825 [Blastocatellia bacterium]|nr:hypothetical protein [Blastocatellia bacterium]